MAIETVGVDLLRGYGRGDQLQEPGVVLVAARAGLEITMAIRLGKAG
jgi:hypothetical protein